MRALSAYEIGSELKLFSLITNRLILRLDFVN